MAIMYCQVMAMVLVSDLSHGKGTTRIQIADGRSMHLVQNIYALSCTNSGRMTLMIAGLLELEWVQVVGIKYWIYTACEVTVLMIGDLRLTCYIFGGIPIVVTKKRAGTRIFKDWTEF